MITALDKEYRETKSIKQGVATLTAPFNELAHWISSTWKVNVLNVIYDSDPPIHGPRLQVILEHKRDALKFHRGMNFDDEKEQAIKERFLEIIDRKGYKFDVSSLFVVFSAFAPIALQEVDNQISEDELNALKDRIGNPDLWEISRSFGHVTFFFYTRLQVIRYKVMGKQTAYAKMYYELLKPHDEFDYLDENEFTVAFDSKQNFDEKYKSSWFNYYR